MKRFTIGLLLTAALGCHQRSGNSHSPRILETGQRYTFVFQRPDTVWNVRIEDIDEEAGWVRVRREDNLHSSWVNLASVERID